MHIKEPIEYELPFISIVSEHLILGGTDWFARVNDRYVNRRFALTKGYKKFKTHFIPYVDHAMSEAGIYPDGAIIGNGSGAWGMRIWLCSDRLSQIDNELDENAHTLKIGMVDIDSPEKPLLDALQESYIIDDDIRIVDKITTKRYRKGVRALRFAIYRFGKFYQEVL